MLDIEYIPTPWLTGDELSGAKSVQVTDVEVVEKEYSRNGKSFECKVLRFHFVENSTPRFVEIDLSDTNRFVRDYGADETKIIGGTLTVMPVEGKNDATWIKMQSFTYPEE